MPEYAYRGVQADGTATRVPVTAASPADVVRHAREAGHHLVMLYRLIRDNNKAQYVPLLDEPNIPLPQVLKLKPEHLWEGGKWFEYYLEYFLGLSQSSQRLQQLVADGRIAGSVGWSRCDVESGPLVQSIMEAMRKRIFAPILRPLPQAEDPTTSDELSDIPVVEVSDDFAPPEELRALLTAKVADLYGVVPYARSGNALILLAEEPDGMKLQDDLCFVLKSEIQLVCSSKNRWRNRARISELIQRTYGSVVPEEYLLQILTPEQVKDFEEFTRTTPAEEEWEGSAFGLPPLPALAPWSTANGFLWPRSGRAQDCIHDDVGLLVETDTDDGASPVSKLCELLVRDAVMQGGSGLRIWSDGRVCHAEFLSGGEWLPVYSPAFRLHEPIVVRLAMAGGIPPTTLAPAESRVDLVGTDRRIELQVKTEFTDWGERLEVRWGS